MLRSEFPAWSLAFQPTAGTPRDPIFAKSTISMVYFSGDFDPQHVNVWLILPKSQFDTALQQIVCQNQPQMLMEWPWMVWLSPKKKWTQDGSLLAVGMDKGLLEA